MSAPARLPQVVDLTARRESKVDLQARLMEVLWAAIQDRHAAAHRRYSSIHECSDPVCTSYSELMTAVER
mgnify:CR=1 FL=1